MKSDFSQMKLFQKRLELAAREQKQQFFEDCARELAARFLAKVIKRTPVGIYRGDEYISRSGKKRYKKYKTVDFSTAKGKHVSFKANVSGKSGGTLRRGWTSKTESEAIAGSGKGEDVSKYAESLKIEKKGGFYQVTITNVVSYSEYVEFGHRTRGHKGWVPGQFMMTISEKELQAAAPGVLKKKFKEFLQGVLDGK